MITIDDFTLDEIIQCEIECVKNILDLNISIIYTTDEKQWAKLTKRRGHPVTVDCSVGESYNDIGYVFFNLREIHSFKELKRVIFHELAHIKFPFRRLNRNVAENRIKAYEDKYLK